MICATKLYENHSQTSLILRIWQARRTSASFFCLSKFGRPSNIINFNKILQRGQSFHYIRMKGVPIFSRGNAPRASLGRSACERKICGLPQNHSQSLRGCQLQCCPAVRWNKIFFSAIKALAFRPPSKKNPRDSLPATNDINNTL